jgi:hypothetical protein
MRLKSKINQLLESCDLATRVLIETLALCVIIAAIVAGIASLLYGIALVIAGA